MNKIIKFYKNKNNLDILKSIINGKSYLSLRVIDFFVTNYSKDKKIIYTVKENNNNKNFMVHYSYKSQLKAYSKKRFDPFCRRERILFFIDKHNGIDKEPIRTTVGQLNFFRWAIKNNILNYIHKNYDSIEKYMNTYSKNKNKKTIVLSKNNIKLSTTKKVNEDNVTITVKFN